MHAPASNPVSASPCPPIPASLPLTPLQFQAAHLLATGHRISDIARSLSVSRATLYRWQQAPDFAAYFNQLVRQHSDEALAASSCLMVDSLSLVRETLADPKTPLDRRLHIAFRMMSLYARPSFLKHLNSLSDDPRTIAEAQCRQSFAAMGQPVPPEGFAEDEIALFSCMHAARLQDIEALDAAYPNPESPAPAPNPPSPISSPQPPIPSAPASRDTMKQNETLRERPADPAASPISNLQSPTPPASTPASRDTSRHNETWVTFAPTLASAKTPPRPAAPSPISTLQPQIPITPAPAAIPTHSPVPKLKTLVPFDDPFRPVPPSPSGGAMRQNEAPAACTSAIDAALAGLRQDIALATTGFGVR